MPLVVEVVGVTALPLLTASCQRTEEFTGEVGIRLVEQVTKLLLLRLNTCLGEELGTACISESIPHLVELLTLEDHVIAVLYLLVILELNGGVDFSRSIIPIMTHARVPPVCLGGHAGRNKVHVHHLPVGHLVVDRFLCRAEVEVWWMSFAWHEGV